MERPLLRIASLGLAVSAGFGVLFGAYSMFLAIEAVGEPGEGTAFLAAFAIFIWTISCVIAGVAIWSWRAPFKWAVIGLAVAGAISGYWTTLDLDFGALVTPWSNLVFALVAVMILASVAAACVVSIREGAIGKA